MPKTKALKKEIVKELREKIKKWKTILFLDFEKVKSKELFDLRKKIKSLKKDFKIIKKNLAQIAFDEEKVKFNVKELKGQIALAFGEKEDIDLIKAVYDFSKENENLKILTCLMEKKLLNSQEITQIAKLPSRKELLAQFSNTISCPLRNLNFLLIANLRNFISVLSQIKGQKQT